jgi:phosphohistidine phosphatase
MDTATNNAHDTSLVEKNYKTLLIIRHAKSSWEIGILNDFERPLNERGKKDAPVMAKRVREKNIFPDALVSSPAKRAKKTAELFAELFETKKEDIIFISKLYHATTGTLYEVVEVLSDSFNTVALFSHNPGISEFVNILIPDVYIDNMPTCGVFAIKINTDKWVHFKKATKELLFFDYPKLG